MWIVRNRKIFYVISALLMLASIAAIIIYGLRPSIEFSGGTLIEVTYEGERPSKDTVMQVLNEEVLSGTNQTLQEVRDDAYLLRTVFLDEDRQDAVTDILTANNGASITRISSIGPSISGELVKKAFVAFIVVIAAIILFIAFTFRKVSAPVQSWKYGLIAIIALVHDTLIPTGAFAVLGALSGYEVDVLFVMAILAILGYSVNDTIVVFDRVRENLSRNMENNTREPFDEVVGRSLSQTIARSINTSLTTMLVVVALYIFGAVSTQHFALVLHIGLIAGTYSSIFLASPLLVEIEHRQKKKA